MRAAVWGAFFLFATAVPAPADTMDAVTYYSAVSDRSSDRFHTGRMTVGDPYSLINPPDVDLPNGTLLVLERLGIGTAAPAGRLQVMGRDDVPESVVFMPGTDTLANPGTPSVWVGVDTEVPEALFHMVSEEASEFILESAGDVPDFGAELTTRRSRGRPTAPAGLTDNDDLGGLKFLGFGLGVYAEGATIDSNVQGVPGPGNVPSEIIFLTSKLQRLNIIANGNVGIGSTSPLSTLDLSGTTVTGNVTLNATHNVVLCDNGANMTVTLPAASGCRGRTYTIKKISTNAATVTIDPNGAETIDGVSIMLLNDRQPHAEIISDGAAWYVISGEARNALQFGVTPIQLIPITGSTTGWITVNVSPWLPPHARSFVIYTVMAQHSGSPTIRLEARQDSSSPSIHVLSMGNSYQWRAGHGWVPLAPNQTFQYKITKTGSGSIELESYLRGYYN